MYTTTGVFQHRDLGLLNADGGSLRLALIKHGADPSHTCRKGTTAIDYARAALKSKKTRTPAGAKRALDAMLKG